VRVAGRPQFIVGRVLKHQQGETSNQSLKYPFAQPGEPRRDAGQNPRCIRGDHEQRDQRTRCPPIDPESSRIKGDGSRSTEGSGWDMQAPLR
jgi:hypothetical protein